MNPLDHLPESPPTPTVAVIILLLLLAVALVVVPATKWLFKSVKKTVAFLHGKVSIAVALGFAAALGFTLFSADSSWRFAGKMGMTDNWERGILFGVAELGVLALVFMARQNLNSAAKTPGVPGTLVKVVVGVQVIPAFEVSDSFWIGVVRAFFGPVMAMLMWHLMLDIELKHKDADAENNSMFAQLAREARTRIFASMGLAERNKTALEIVRDRNLNKAVDLYAELEFLEEGTPGRWDKRQIAKKHKKASKYASLGCGGDLKRRRELTTRLAERRQARQLSSMMLPEVWNTTELLDPEAHALAMQTRTVVREGVMRAATAPELPIVPRQSAPVLPTAQPAPETSLQDMAARLRARNAASSAAAPGGKAVAFAEIDPALDDPRKHGGEEYPRTDDTPTVSLLKPRAPEKPEPDPDPDPQPPSGSPGPHAEPARPHPAPLKEPVVAEEPVKEPASAGASTAEPEPEPEPVDEPVDEPETGEDPAEGELTGRKLQQKIQEDARQVYRESVAAGKPVESESLGKQFGKSVRWAQDRIKEVKAETTKKPEGGRRLRAVNGN
jgi:hypothetical protein